MRFFGQAVKQGSGSASDARFRLFSDLILIGAATFYILLNPLFRIGFFNDDAVYMLAARHFWDGTVVFPTVGFKPYYPMPGLPFLLSFVVRWIKPHWLALEWLAVVSMLASFFFLSRWIRSYLSPLESIFVLSLFALNPAVARFSGSFLPAPFYTLAVIGTLLWLTKFLKDNRVSSGMALGVIVGWASLLRPEGILIAVSVFYAVIFNRQRGLKIWAIALPLTCWGVLYGAWFYLNRFSGSELQHDLHAILTFGKYRDWSPLHVLIDTSKILIVDTIWFQRIFSQNLSTALALFAMLIISIAAVKGFISLLKEPKIDSRVTIALGTFVCLFVSFHIVWHVGTPRHFLPVLPLILILVVRGLKEFLMRIQLRTLSAVVLLTFVLSSYVYQNSAQFFRREPERVNSPPWKTLSWIQANVASNEMIASNMTPSILLYTDRKSQRGVNATNPEQYLYLLMKYQINYVVRRSGMTTMVGKKARWLSLYPERFRTVFKDAHEGTLISKVIYDDTYKRSFETFIRASTNFKEKRYQESLRAVHESLSLFSGLGSANNLLGALHMFKGEHTLAEKAFLEAARRMPDSTAELLNLATVYHLQGNYEQSRVFQMKGMEVSARNGEQDTYASNLAELKQQWDLGRAPILVDMPDVDSYEELSG